MVALPEQLHPMKTCRFQATVAFFLSLALSASAATLHVDLNTPSPAPPYTNWITAATNIQDAVDVANAGDEIIVTNGVYQTGSRSADAATTNRLVIDKPVVVQSVNGAAVTLIDGGGLVRCAYLSNGARLAGFTLTNGAMSGSGGGVFLATAVEAISNCVLIANSAGIGGGAFQGSLYNCALIGNTAWNHGGGADSGTLNNCTLVGNTAGSGAGGGANACTLNNCIVYSNNLNYSASTLNYSCTTPLPANGAHNLTTLHNSRRPCASARVRRAAAPAVPRPPRARILMARRGRTRPPSVGTNSILPFPTSPASARRQQPTEM